MIMPHCKKLLSVATKMDDIPDLILIDGGKGQLNAHIQWYPMPQSPALAKTRRDYLHTTIKKWHKA